MERSINWTPTGYTTYLPSGDKHFLGFKISKSFFFLVCFLTPNKKRRRAWTPGRFFFSFFFSFIFFFFFLYFFLSSPYSNFFFLIFLSFLLFFFSQLYLCIFSLLFCVHIKAFARTIPYKFIEKSI